MKRSTWPFASGHRGVTLRSGGAGNSLWSCRFSAFHDRPSCEICPSSENCREHARKVLRTTTSSSSKLLRSDSTVWSEFAFGPVGHCFLCCNQFFAAVMWSLCFPFFWSCVCHYIRLTTLRTRPVNMFLDARSFDYYMYVFLFRRSTRLKEGPTLQYVCRRVYIFKWKAQN